MQKKPERVQVIHYGGLERCNNLASPPLYNNIFCLIMSGVSCCISSFLPGLGWRKFLLLQMWTPHYREDSCSRLVDNNIFSRIHDFLSCKMYDFAWKQRSIVLPTYIKLTFSKIIFKMVNCYSCNIEDFNNNVILFNRDTY